MVPLTTTSYCPVWQTWAAGCALSIPSFLSTQLLNLLGPYFRPCCQAQLGEEKFQKLVNSSFRSFDRDKDGRLDYEEFVQLFNKMQATIERVNRRKQANVVVADISTQRRQSGDLVTPSISFSHSFAFLILVHSMMQTWLGG